MSKRVQASVQCPSCGYIQNAVLFRSIWAEDHEYKALIMNDEVNTISCDQCGCRTRLEFPFLCTNVERGVAIWYEPYYDKQIDLDLADYSKHMGPNSFYAKAPRIADWNAFKAKYLEMEAAGPQPGQEVRRSREMQQAFRGFLSWIKNRN